MSVKVTSSIPYWLSYIYSLSKGSPVILVQTLRLGDQKSSPTFSVEEKMRYQIKDVLSVDSSSDKATSNGFKKLKSSIEETLAEQILKSCTQIPTQWYLVKQAIIALQDKSDKELSLNDFNILCNEQELNADEAKTLLNHFHNTGLIFYREHLFKNKIILDQQWAIEAIYTVLERTGLFASHFDQGKISGQILSSIWTNKGYSQEEQELFVSFMLSCEICFKEEHREDNISFTQKTFVAPQLLTNQKPNSAQRFESFVSPDCIYYRYKHLFLHAAVMQRFIVRMGYLSQLPDMWQQGLYIEQDDCKACIETDINNNEINIKVSGKGREELLKKIREQLYDISKEETDINEFISIDGEHYINTDQFKKQLSHQGQVQAEDGA
ncbi:MAG: hypothetical protein HYZ42_16920, partial [Bacteroidetes bacterium]|nr:hypothetical protein [Bacteroidota bacterium]